ncbi:hypothetical protein WBG78_07265 [Chryseolinea sp. T2]|uniref:hypothetical protein n=1 Tax=Chryseolinea sp. T2 TaxID=3129255 RepID=UPI0030774552
MSREKLVIHFYSPEARDIPRNNADATNPIYYSSGLHHWLHFTFCYFKYIDLDHPFEVVITGEMPDEGVIVFHRGWVEGELKPNDRQLFVCLLVDYGRHRFSQIQVVHNPTSVNNFKVSAKSFLDKLFPFAKETFIPSWPQPGLIPRLPERGYEIKNVGFVGHAQNLPIELRTSAWQSRCEELKVNFQIVSEASKWADFSQMDLILAMRSFDKRPYYNKPFLKITNALFAGVPVVASSESSHLYLKNVKRVDFPIADSVEELVTVIKSVKENATQEFKKVMSNQRLIAEYDNAAIFDAYKRLFQESFTALHRWSNSPKFVRWLYFKLRALKF